RRSGAPSPGDDNGVKGLPAWDEGTRRGRGVTMCPYRNPPAAPSGRGAPGRKRMSFGKLRQIVAAALVARPLLVSAAGAQQPVAPLDRRWLVRLALCPILKFATLYVAAERGLFEKYGLDVDIDIVASGTEAIASLEQGQIAVGGIAIVTSLWNGWNQGIDVRVFAPGGLE